MFSEDVLESDKFLDMSTDAQILYVHMCMSADDDGFVGGKKRIIRMLGVGDTAYKELISSGFVIEFSSGISVISHWKVNNQIKKDRYNPTVYLNEYAQLDFSRISGYTLKSSQEKINIEKELPEISQREQAEIKETEEKNRPAEAYSVGLPKIKIIGGKMHVISPKEFEELSKKYPDLDIWAEITSLNRGFENGSLSPRDEDSISWYIDDWCAKKQFSNKTVI